MPARILVVDDDEVSLQFTSYVLKRSGHTVLQARHGAEGLATAGLEMPDIVLTDMQMAGMGGAELCRALRADERLAAIPLVAVTAYAMVGAEEEVLAHGFDGYIPKPFQLETFVREVETHLPPALRTLLQPVPSPEG
jgi:CheY-like chemotaxis protein